MRTFPAIVCLAGALCVAKASANAGDDYILLGRITVKASTSALAAPPPSPHATARAATTIALPKRSGAETSIVKKAPFTCADLVVHVFTVRGVPVKPEKAFTTPDGLCHYQVQFSDPAARGDRDVITVKVDSPRFKIAGSTQVHLNTATQGGFVVGDVTAVRY